MTVALGSQPATLPLTSRLVNVVLSIQPLALLAKRNARNMMIKRAEAIGVSWRQEVQALRTRGEGAAFSPAWEAELAAVQNPNLVYPDYYCCSFHAYEEGNLGWEPAMEVEVAAHAVHARIWPDGGAEGDTRLRQSFLNLLKEQGPENPQAILDLGCSVGMSTFALQSLYPRAALTGVDLSPYFLAIAHHRARTGRQPNSLHTLQVMGPRPDAPAPRWLHAAAEETGLPDASFDLVSAFLMFHELPQSAAVQVLREARRVLRPGGIFALMDMNPKSDIYAKMPPYILTLLKSTEPYLDQYFALDLEQALIEAGFEPPTVTCNTPRHRTVIARAC